MPSCYDFSDGATYQKLPLTSQILGGNLLSFLLSCPGLLVVLFLGLLLITGVLNLALQLGRGWEGFAVGKKRQYWEYHVGNMVR